MKHLVICLILVFGLIASNCEAHWIRVSDKAGEENMINDSSSHRANISKTRTGQIIEVPSRPFPIHGDHFINGVVIQDSIRRQEAIDERIARTERKITTRTKLQGLGFTNEEVRDIIGSIYGD